MRELGRSRMPLLVGLLVLAAGGGCRSTCGPDDYLCTTPMPRELDKVTMPEYVIEPPDLLEINVGRLVPLPPYRVEPLDVLLVQVKPGEPNEPVNGPFPVDADGSITLGLSYKGPIKVVGLTLEEVKAAVQARMKQIFTDPQEVTVALGQSRGLQQVRGEHLVRPDGSVFLGTYGPVRVAGLTLAQARKAVEAVLAQKLQNPEVSLDVAAYNSKVYYVILDGAGAGQQVVRLPITGNETVLDAISKVNGLTTVSSKDHIWVARPAPACSGPDQVMAVDWRGITTRAKTATNYQLLPGDRVYVMGDPRVTVDTNLARIIAPFERIFGFTLLGSSVVQTMQQFPVQSGGPGGFASGF